MKKFNSKFYDLSWRYPFSFRYFDPTNIESTIFFVAEIVVGAVSRLKSRFSSTYFGSKHVDPSKHSLIGGPSSRQSKKRKACVVMVVNEIYVATSYEFFQAPWERPVCSIAVERSLKPGRGDL